ncbi:MAG: SpoVR family protein [SAR324 cluster bacterium]|nr:SpoVR family protein [SAR324 cluster bacterium]
MRTVKTDPELYRLEQRVLHHAKAMGRSLPEIRFFILDSWEFLSLLEKYVYPVSPINIWEGKRVITKKHRVESGQESSLYYEVVQTGNPSYAYLNATNSPMMQASVMAHVCGHCEFSELNVLEDSNSDRTEYVMYLVKKANAARQQMGDKVFLQYWNACESLVPLLSPHSQFNLARSISSDSLQHHQEHDTYVPEDAKSDLMQPFSHTMNRLLQSETAEGAWKKEMRKKIYQEAMSRHGYTLKAPCQDVMGFLCNYASVSKGEKAILNYMTTVHATHDFVIRTQIMNEGWAMYWEKKIMLELFKEKAVKGIIDYAKVFSGVCYPRPYYMRNPYHLGFYMWNHIEELYRDGKVCLEYLEETDQKKKENWNRGNGSDPVKAMEHLVGTITDYDFLRRFLTVELIEEFHLNRINKREAQQIGLSPEDVIKEDSYWVWIDPQPVKEEMLKFFTHFYRPRIYIIDTDFQDGGLLLYHRDDGRRLKKNWIKPTLKNLNLIWKGPVFLISKNWLYSFSANLFKEAVITEVSFEQIQEKISNSEQPFRF